MKEAAFVKQNRSRWEEFERVVKDPSNANPDVLAELFIQVTDDLSFARTKFPGTRTAQYLNALAAKTHLVVYKNKSEDKDRFRKFWVEEVPMAVYEARKELMYSAIIFCVAMVIGALSSFFDDTFVRLIMSDAYVNMTLENIKKGNPTDVYGRLDEGLMFVYITWNNIMVSFKVFIAGIIASIGSAFLLFNNGVMVGAFMTFFYKEQQLSQALPVIMLHGTIELTSIVVAGAAGFSLGNGLIFPGTYPRMTSFRMGAKRGLKIIVGLVPFFIVAGFIESFITRYAFMHWSLKAFIILASAGLMIWYFIIYPFTKAKNANISGN